MSKERARRRAERAAGVARKAEKRAHDEAAAARWRDCRARLTWLLPSRSPQSGGAGLLAAKRRRARGLVLSAFLVVQFLTWVSTPDWGLRVAVLLISLFALPVVAALSSSR